LKDSHFVPATGTNVGFTSKWGKNILWLSSSGGGLFGRLTTRKSCEALLNFWGVLLLAAPRLGPLTQDVYNPGQSLQEKDHIVDTPLAIRGASL
jgi:hypothetical protein